MRKNRKIVIALLLMIGIIITCIYCMKSFFDSKFITVIADNRTMEPFIPQFSKVIILNKSKGIRYKKGEVVAYQYLNDKDLMGNNGIGFSRVAGIEGDIVSFENGKLYVNGMLLNIKPFKENKYSYKPNFNKKTSIVVLEKKHFVLDDNYWMSYDSRDWGQLSEQNILGKVIAVIPEDKKLIKNKNKRKSGEGILTIDEYLLNAYSLKRQSRYIEAMDKFISFNDVFPQATSEQKLSSYEGILSIAKKQSDIEKFKEYGGKMIVLIENIYSNTSGMERKQADEVRFNYFVDLGNLLYESGDVVTAVLNFEKALFLIYDEDLAKRVKRLKKEHQKISK